jgi:uncharacterized integral membrane protein
MGYLVVAVVAVAVAVFVLQNTTVVTVQFAIWKIEQVPLAAVVLMSLGAGVVMIGLPLYYPLWRARRGRRGHDAPRPLDDSKERPRPPL